MFQAPDAVGREQLVDVGLALVPEKAVALWGSEEDAPGEN
jgi:hypothetical protein